MHPIRPPDRAPETPPDTIICAIGDLHGRVDLLRVALAQLRGWSIEAKQKNKRLIAVFLGDYIDRGPHGRDVVDELLRAKRDRTAELVFLRGNHEQALLDFLDGAPGAERWLGFGGRETLASYGFHGAAPEAPDEVRRFLHTAMRPEHLQFLRDTQLLEVIGNYAFVHAGLRPDRLVEEQSDADLLWWRYYDDERPVHGLTVVHGHTPNPSPVVGRWRIGIDTEAYETGALTLLRLEDSRRTLMKLSEQRDGHVKVEEWESLERSYSRREQRQRPPRSGGTTRLRTNAAKKPPLMRGPKRRRYGVLLGTLALVVALTLLLLAGRLLEGRAEASVSPQPPTPFPSSYDAKPEVSLRGREEQPTPPRRSPDPAVGPAAQTSDTASRDERAVGPRAQFAALPSEALAREAWADLRQAFPDATADRSLVLEPVESSGRRLLRAAAGGFATRDEAARFCRVLVEGGRDCLVRN